jgi:hypothetical protein
MNEAPTVRGSAAFRPRRINESRSIIGRSLKAGLLLVLAALAFVPRTFAQASSEYDLKAVFLFNFASFIEWPRAAFATPSSPFIIATIGADPFGKTLDEVVAGENINGHPIVVRRYDSVQQVRAQRPHILFVCASERGRLPQILEALAKLPTLTVSDVPGFLEAGGGINFSTTKRVQIRINADATQTAGLAVSSKLLRLAQGSEGRPR